MVYIEDLIVIVFWLALIVTIIDLSLIVYILCRRLVRNRFFARKDAARQQYSGLVNQFASGRLSVSEARTALHRVRAPAQTAAVQELLLAAATVGNRERLSDLLFQLGYIKMWAVQAFGVRRARQLIKHITSARDKAQLPSCKRHFQKIRRLRVFAVKRALPVGNFGHLAPRFSEVLLAESLRDPSPYVTGLAVAALGKIDGSSTVPILLEELRKALHGQSQLPVRAVKTALVRRSVDDLKEFFPCLSSNDDGFRLLLVDTIREMVNAKPSSPSVTEFPRELYQWFAHEAVCDASADVRARSAAVIHHFHDENSVVVLGILLHDQNEYVRLHAARACRDRHYVRLIPDLAECMTDPRWRVREAAAKSLAAIGEEGVECLADFFLATDDRYASEQIADELQRSGLVFQLVSALGSSRSGARRAAAVCTKMANLGMTSAFLDLLVREASVPLRTELMELLANHPSPQLTKALQKISLRADDPLKDRADGFLSAAAAQAAAAAGR